ncbi:MAG: glycosyltransferase family 39 protein [Mucispirillum sp.]|nr:glycosyltransferase family 39 protein [Mucispirillum sp.]
MTKTNRMAVFFIILAAIYYCWNAYILPVRGDEAYLYLKSLGLSWTTLAPTGLVEYILKGMDFFGSSALQLRLPSIIFISFSALIIYELTLKLSDNYGAWFSMILFFVSPPITYSYMSMTPNALLIFCFVLYIYAFYMIAVDDKSVKYYVWMAVSIIFAISVDFSGILLLLNHIVYSFIKKDMLSDKMYLFVTVLSAAVLLIFGLSHYYGVFDLFYKYPVESEMQFVYRFLLFVIIYLPVIFIIFSAVRNRRIDDKVFPLFTACIIFAAGGIVFSLVSNYDVRNLGALLIPAIVLSGYYYEIYGYKVTIGVITAVLVLVSAYTNISSKSLITPRYIENTRVYESTRIAMQSILGSYDNCIFSYDPELSSILSYNTFTYPEACTIEECDSTFGVFVSKEKEDNLAKYFAEVHEANIYRFMSIKDGEFKLYFYQVNGLKKNQK